MPILTDGRFSIRAEAVVDTKGLRELTGNRHRQDPEHERHLRERGDADTLATHLLGRDDTHVEELLPMERSESEQKEEGWRRNWRSLVPCSNSCCDKEKWMSKNKQWLEWNKEKEVRKIKARVEEQPHLFLCALFLSV